MHKCSSREWSSGNSCRVLALLVLVLCMPAVGCSKTDPRTPVFPVHGRVLLNGEPLPHAFVTLHPVNKAEQGKLHPHAQAEPDGTFWLSTYDSEDGAPVGEYFVTVQKFKPPKDSDTGPPVNLVSGRYANPTTSNLRVRVEPTTNELPALKLNP
ncbi:MAG TPA: hypothetical protein VK395_19200 [Gemmataceae bacterium]|nr:hypothetical protein [Gemmataceae bacterium]